MAVCPLKKRAEELGSCERSVALKRADGPVIQEDEQSLF